MGDAHHVGQVHVDDIGELRQVGKVGPAMGDAGAIDHDIKRAKPADQAVDGGMIAHVQSVKGDASVGQIAGGLGQLGSRSAGADDLRAKGGKAAGEVKDDATGGTRDQDGLALETVGPERGDGI